MTPRYVFRESRVSRCKCLDSIQCDPRDDYEIETPYRQVPCANGVSFCYRIGKRFHPESVGGKFNLRVHGRRRTEGGRQRTEDGGKGVLVHRFHRLAQMGKGEGFPANGREWARMGANEGREAVFPTNHTNYHELWKKTSKTVMLLRKICVNLCNLWITHPY